MRLPLFCVINELTTSVGAGKRFRFVIKRGRNETKREPHKIVAAGISRRLRLIVVIDLFITRRRARDE